VSRANNYEISSIVVFLDQHTKKEEFFITCILILILLIHFIHNTTSALAMIMLQQL